MQLNAQEGHPKVAGSETVSKQKWHSFIRCRESRGRERQPEETGGEGELSYCQFSGTLIKKYYNKAI